MGIVLVILVILTGLAVLAASAAEVGVDTRFDLDDTHAPLHGAA